MAARVPMHNILYLYCYAWDLFHEGESLAAEIDDEAPFQDLLAHVLVGAMTRLFRAGIARAYQDHSDIVDPLRGRPDFAASLPLLARRRRAIVSAFDELSPDTPRNRILKAAMRLLAAAEALDADLRRSLGGLIRRMDLVEDIRLHAGHFAGLSHERASAGYRMPLALARLALDCLVPIAGSGRHRFTAPLENADAMGRLFEAFVRNFLHREQDHFHVGRQTLAWLAEGAEQDRALLPRMETDVFLRSDARRIIIETKFYPEALQYHHDVAKARSLHLYQLFSYLRNTPQAAGQLPVEGILLYPAVGVLPAMDVRLHGHRVRLETVPLDQKWPVIRQQLLSLVQAPAGMT